MATRHPHALQAQPDAAIRSRALPLVERASADARMRRWCVLAIVAAALLAMYAGGLVWTVHRVEAGVDRSLQPLPTLVHEQPQP